MSYKRHRTSESTPTIIGRKRGHNQQIETLDKEFN